MIYGGVVLDDFFRVNFSRPIMPPVEVSALDIGLVGSRFQRARIQPLAIPVTLRWRRRPGEDMAKLRRTAASLLYSKEPKKLELPDEPGLYYMAVVNGESVLDNLWYTGKAEVEFYCADPIAYGKTISHEFSGKITGIYQGTWETRPVFTLKPGKVNSLRVTNYKTGEFVEVGASFTEASEVVIDCAAEQTRVNGNNQAVTLASDYFSIAPGEFDIRLSAGQGSMSYQERWL